MGSIIDNLTNAINTWNEKLAEIWLLLTQTPQNFKGGNIWNVIVKIHGGLQAIGLALLVLFFAVVDRIGTERHELSGRAKDQGSAAVFIALCIVIVVWGSILFF